VRQRFSSVKMRSPAFRGRFQPRSGPQRRSRL